MTTGQAYTFCKKCNIEISARFEPTPNLIHDGKLICPLCDSFLGWKKKEKNEGKRERNKYTPAKLGINYCQLCMRSRERLGINETLVPHHIKEIQDDGEDVPENIWVVCTACHSLIHHQRTYLNNHTAPIWEKYEMVKNILSEANLGNGQYDQAILAISELIGA